MYHVKKIHIYGNQYLYICAYYTKNKRNILSKTILRKYDQFYWTFYKYSLINKARQKILKHIRKLLFYVLGTTN